MGMSSFCRTGDTEVELHRLGSGRPLLLLESEDQLERDSSMVERLAASFEVIIPSAPGFGRSNRPDHIGSMDDIAYVYNQLLHELDLRELVVLGFSLGGWIAAEMASKADHRLSKMILVDPYGVKHGGTTDRDVADIWILHPDKVAALRWYDVEKGKRDYSTWPDEDLRILARNRESFARFCWAPYMHNPKLRHRLAAVQVPVHFIWGARDGIVTPDYGRKYAALFRHSSFLTIADAGHFPHIEQPERFEAVLADILADDQITAD